ncbi:MAG: vitamin K epoxide reductase family protein [Actinomycetia bacterium]|nr:vitamin K epoxide reductase family protein [Actinomycetes bacterium]
MRRTYWTWACSLAGMAIGTYLTVLHYAALPVGCPATPTINCQTVLSSSGSMVGPFPLTAWGLVWSLGPLVLRRGYALWAAVGIAGLLWAVGHELALGEICLWCTAFQVCVLGDIVSARPYRLRTGSRPSVVHRRWVTDDR